MRRLFFFCFIVFAYPGLSFAQTVISGSVVESTTGDPIPGAHIRSYLQSDSLHSHYSVSNSKGIFRIHLPYPGSYTLVASGLGYKEEKTEVEVTDSVPHAIIIRLIPSALQSDEVVVSASRVEEKAIDAPASISVISAKEIAARPTLAVTDHLRAVPGVDIAQTGLVQQNLVVRGFNNVFSGQLLVLTDNRNAGVPSLHVNVPYFIPAINDDIERIELVRGPGSALYGPDAAQGVLNIITKSPFASQGTQVSLTGGSNGNTSQGSPWYYQATMRHAGTIGEQFGYKISGSYLRGMDWPNFDSAESAARSYVLAHGANTDTLIGIRNRSLEKYSLEARVDWLPMDDLAINGTAGLTWDGRSVELADVGAAQARDWRYAFYQTRINYKDLFAQVFLNQSNAGSTYLVRTGAPIVDRSTQFDAQIQHKYSFGERERLVYGLDYIFVNPVTDGTINGHNENNDNIVEIGGYLQSETHFDPFELVLAGRLDHHNRLESLVFSPRAALVYKPEPNTDLRVTYNRAYQPPTSTDLFLDLDEANNIFPFPPSQNINIRASGLPTTGFNFDQLPNGELVFHSAFLADRSTRLGLNSSTGTLWDIATGVVSQRDTTGLANVLFALIKQMGPGPTNRDIATTLQLLDATAGKFVTTTTPQDIPRLKPTINQTIEFGYKSVIANILQIDFSIYGTQITNLTGPLQNATPNVFLDSNATKAYLLPRVFSALISQGSDSATATTVSRQLSDKLGSAIGSIPLGTVTPREATDPTSIIYTTRNFGRVEMWGVDLGMSYQISPNFGIQISYSHMNPNYFVKLDNITDVALNAPRDKGALTLTLDDPNDGLNFELRDRYADGFSMNSGVYVGEVHAHNRIDAKVDYRMNSRVDLTLSGLNIFNDLHPDFVGAPAIGSMYSLRVGYTIPN